MQAKEMHPSTDVPAWSYPLPTIKQQQQEKAERRQQQFSASSTAQATIASRSSFHVDPRLLPSNGCDYPASRDDQHSSLSAMSMTQPLTTPNDLYERSHTHTPNSDHRMPMSYQDISSIGEGSNYHRQQHPLAPVHADVRPSAPAYGEDVTNYWHDCAPAPHRETTIAAAPPPNSLGLSFYNGWDGATQLGYRYTDTHPPYTAGNGANDDEYSQETGEGALDTVYNTGYDTGYGAGRHIDNRRGYQGRQRSSLSPPRYAGPAFAYSPYHGGHIANGDHRYRHRSSVSPATPAMGSISTSASAYTPAPVSQHPDSQSGEGAAHQQYRPYPLPDAHLLL